MSRHFLSDNASGIHPRVLKAIENANGHHEPAYGNDRYTTQAKKILQKHFGSDSQCLFALTGTATNVIALQSVLQSYEAVICADSSHLYNDECGAPEKLIGCKLLVAKTNEGKLSPKVIEPLLQDVNMVHRVQPRVLSIAQCTEWGTVYTFDEMKQLASFCHEHGLLLHVDGARFCNAVAALDVDLKTLSRDCGIDLLSFGGTKNGLMGAEAIVFINPDLGKNAAFIRKQITQLASKMRFIAAQFIALFEQNLWWELACHANKMAALLADEIASHVEIVMPVQSNVIFAKLPSLQVVEKLQAVYKFAVWKTKPLIVRWMTSFDTTEEDVKKFAELIRNV